MKQLATRAKKTIPAVRPAVGSNAAQSHVQDPPSMDEPRLRDLLQDDILLKLMSSDKVEPVQLQLLLDDTRARLFN